MKHGKLILVYFVGGRHPRLFDYMVDASDAIILLAFLPSPDGGQGLIE